MLRIEVIRNVYGFCDFALLYIGGKYVCMIKHYSGSLGDFDYDDTLWEIGFLKEKHKNGLYNSGESIHYIGNSCSVSIPKGLITYNRLFFNCVFNDTFILEYADLANCKDTEWMFGFCNFYNGIDLKDSFDTRLCKNFIYCRLFANSEFYKFINLGRNFYVGNFCFEGSTFKKGCNLLSIKTRSDRVNCCLKDCKLNDDFCLPDVLFNVFESNFSDKVVCPLRFPSYVMSESDSFELYGLNMKLFDFDEDEYQQAVNYVSEQLNDAVKKMISAGKNISNVSKEIVAMLRQRKSKDDVLSTLVSKGMSLDLAISLYNNTVKPLKGKCKNDIAKIFVVEGKSSKYTVGEVREYLQDRGYPEEIANNCLLEYLQNEYLV